MLRKFLSSAGLLLTTCFAQAQSQGPVYQYMPNVTVTANGYVQSMPFCGGLNNPQFTMGDLNNDGLQDLVVFENNIGVKTFINTGMVSGKPKYVYAPKYELNFPACTSYLTLVYNKDGAPMLFTQVSYLGFIAYDGYFNAQNELCFTYNKALWYHNDTINNFGGNAYVNLNRDIPAIVDVNNDGAADFLSFDINGKFVVEYKNESRIGGYPTDSLIIYLKDNCWGKFYEGFFRKHVLGSDCNSQGQSVPSYDSFYNKVTSSSNALCLFDYDGDGDYDCLIGKSSYNEMTLLINGRVEKGINGPDSMIAQDTAFLSGGRSIELPVQPAAFNVDIDQDGQKDLLIAPHAAGVSENYKCVWFYKNGTTPGHPSWTFESDTMLIDQMIDVGTAAYPAFFDYDKDGKLDLFVGGDGYYQSSGLLLGKIAYYHNTSTPGNVSFELITKDFLNISGEEFQGVAPTFGDINNDGKKDLIIGHTDGTLSVYLNTAASDNVPPVWQLSGKLLDSAGNVIGLSSQNSAPFIYDLNKDGRPDLIIGGNQGTLIYYENHGTANGILNLVLKTMRLGSVKVDNPFQSGAYSTPYIGRIDNTGPDYLLVGSNSGSLYRYTGFQNGTITGTFQMLDSEYSFIDTTLSYQWHNYGIYGDLRSAPAVADIDGDGKYEMVVGEADGGLKIYEQTDLLNTGIINTPTYKISVFPNPAQNVVTINWEAGFAKQDVTATIYNAVGEKIIMKTVAGVQTEMQVSLSNTPNGIYFCEVVSGNNRSIVQVAIVK